MLKKAAVFLLVLSPAFALSQSACPEVGWTNQAVLIEALKTKGRELMNVKVLAIDAANELIRYENEGSSQAHSFTYETCGYDIRFSDVQSVQE